MKRILAVLACAMLVGCSSMPYRPAQADGAFPGLVDFVATAPGRSVDVLLVHGMCTHDERWVVDTVLQLSSALRAQAQSASAAPMAVAEGIQLFERTITLRQGELRIKALVWSPLTTPLKHQLDYDHSDRLPAVRAKLNARAKDLLMNDCIPDALIYQGVSRDAIQQRMAQAILRATEGAASEAPLLVLSASLGSKILFDTLLRMDVAAQRTIDRIAYLVMAANQIPLLALADQQAVAPGPGARPATPAATAAPGGDSLQAVLRKRRAAATPRAARKLTLVAFSDPNDLLTYTLERERYAPLGVDVVNVLVSNAPTWFGLLERPDHAHGNYLLNPDVARMAACGQPHSARCE
ncbi:hypothetical protein GTP41_02130 [Pseudoduganella sp. DS3]|uniref:Alpha/beta hydrolase n=1 Tax=Pseudoduganella guangdongensis TaxID=2692179 RepID=A0A6N9HBK1_9BURK|nr:hypothetical protein [Pseudoduganella guangdongensis]MYN00888.1 hypothetical protein [Pseudoduganella guangdongensis]